MLLESRSFISTMSLASNKAGIFSLDSATSKARRQLSKHFSWLRLSKSIRSGLNLAMMAQKARPDLQELVKSVTSTPSKSEVTCLAQANNPETPVCSMMMMIWLQRREISHWRVTDLAKLLFARLVMISSFNLVLISTMQWLCHWIFPENAVFTVVTVVHSPQCWILLQISGHRAMVEIITVHVHMLTTDTQLMATAWVL